MIDYEVGQIPSTNLGIEIRDQNGNNISTIGYTVSVEILDTDNREVDVSKVGIVDTGLGQIALVWPKDKSLFTKRGRYLLRLIMKRSDGSIDMTRSAEIAVREFGRLN